MNVEKPSEEKQVSPVGTSANDGCKIDGHELNGLRKENMTLKVFI
jgi:hypothetical protein